MNALRIGWIAIRELIHERFFYILIGFLGASIAFSLLLGQMTYAEKAKLTFDFMLGSTHLILVLFSIFMGVTLFQRELLSGSVSMILSKPISRASFLLGKFLGQIGVQAAMAFCMGALTLGICSQFDGNFSVLATAQTVALIYAESVVLTALTYAFAVNTGSLTTALLTLALFSVGHMRQVVDSAFRAGENPWSWRLGRTLIPDLEIFNMKSLASYGQSLAGTEFFWAVAYALLCLGFYLALALVTFERKDIAT
ncbi:ABC transporter permease [bacterium]|nr:ABC transporter permease [bacterium]